MNPKPGTVKEEWPIRKATPALPLQVRSRLFRRRGRVAQESSLARLRLFSVFSLKDPDRRCQSETHIGTVLTAGRLVSDRGPKYRGARCTCPRGAPTRPGWVHQRCIRVQGRSAADPGMVQLMVQVKGS